MSFEIKFGDITQFHADAIVMPANPEPIIGNGLDKVIYEIAGNDILLHERQKIGKIPFGKAALTEAFNYPSKYIIHTVSPGWVDGYHDEELLLSSCYINSIDIAVKKGCRSIIFPLLSTGVLNYPPNEALAIATRICQDKAQEYGLDITIVLKEEIDILDDRNIYQYILENDYTRFNQDTYDVLDILIQKV